MKCCKEWCPNISALYIVLNRKVFIQTKKTVICKQTWNVLVNRSSFKDQLFLPSRRVLLGGRWVNPLKQRSVMNKTWSLVLTFKSVEKKTYGVQWDLSHCTFTWFCYFISYVILTFESVEEILWRDHSNGTFLTVLSHGSINFVLYVILSFESVEEILWCDHSNGTFPQSFYMVLFFF